MRVFQGASLATLHEMAVNFILKDCYKNKDGTAVLFNGENGYQTIESHEIALVCKTPLNPYMYISDTKKHPFGHPTMLAKYTTDLLEGTSSKFEYDYHTRLFQYKCDSVVTDQIEYIVEKIKANDTTRRAIAVTWQPWIDQVKDDVPCLQLIHCTARDDVLNMKVVFRSEDMLLGLGANMVGLVAIQTAIASRLKMRVGTYTHIAFCPHLYVYRDMDSLVLYENWKELKIGESYESRHD